MKINKYRNKNLLENYIDIHYKEIDDPVVKGIIEYCEAVQEIIGKQKNVQKKIAPSEIYYCEIVDRKCYAYLEEEVYQIDYSIQKLIDSFSRNGFVRVSKAMIINSYKIDYLKTDINMRVHIYMNNGEKVILNRTYKQYFLNYICNMRRENDNEND